MKRLIIIAFVIILLLGACGIPEPEEKPEEKFALTFRGHQYGDTLEDIIEKEGKEPYDQDESVALFRLDDYYGYNCLLFFDFDGNDLTRIPIGYFPDKPESNIQEIFDAILPNLINEFGDPYQIGEYEDSSVAMWWKDGYAWSFDVNERGFLLDINLEYNEILDTTSS